MKCEGCGARLQWSKPGKPGYIPKEVFDRRLREGAPLLCQRCFRLRHYGEDLSVGPVKDALQRLKKSLSNYQHILFIVDITDFEATYRKELMKLLHGKPVTVVVNKIDLLPRAVTIDEIKQWLKNRLGSPKFFPVSAMTGYGLRRLRESLEKISKPSLVIGCTNVGKSSILSRLTENDFISVSDYPGTTQGMLKLKTPGGAILVDTPGIPTRDRLTDLLDPSCVMKLKMARTLSRLTFKPGEGRIIFIGGMCRFKILKVDELRPIFQIFAPPYVKLHETSEDRMNERFEEWFGRFLTPPCGWTDPYQIKWKSVELQIDKGQELVVYGLGWVNVKRGPLVVEVTIPEKVGYTIREGLINPERGG